MRLKSKSAVSWTRARPGSDHRGNDGLDLIAHPLLERDLALVGAHAARRLVAVAVGQQAAGFVDDRNALRLQPVDGGRGEMADRPHLRRIEAAAHLEHDRSRRLRLFAREQRPLGQHQVHPRRLDAIERPDGAGELALERAQVIDVLDEAGGAERVGLVENLVADAAALGQPAFGELHAQPGDALLGHHQDGALVPHLVGNRLPLQVFHDGGRILGREVGEQRRHLRRRHAHDQEGEESDERDRDRAHCDDPGRAERSEERNGGLHGDSA